ncbi:MAG: hypothetical protein MJZ61_05380 [Bacteroidales bacterium]|nr:hypothetical protein [Bacteroidales bacterium]
MDLSKLKTNKRILKSLANSLKESHNRNKTIDDLWIEMLNGQILSQFKFKLPENPETENTMDDFKAMLAEFDINGLRIKEKQRRYNGIWATNGKYDESEDIMVDFKNFKVKATYDPDSRRCSWSSFVIDLVDAKAGNNILSGCRYEHLDKMDLRRIVTMLINLDNGIDDFRENQWPEMKTNIQKQVKLTQMAENTIELLLKGKMAGTGIPYVIEKQKIRVKATFDVGKKTMVEMAISHNNFTKELDKIIETVKQLKNFIEQADMQVRIKAITASNSRYLRWQNTGSQDDNESQA